MKHLMFALCLTFTAVACHPAPPAITPQAQAAFYGTQAIHGLDLLRNFAVDAEKQNPKLISTETMLKVVRYHRVSIVMIHDIPNGWKATVLTGLDEAVKNLPTDEGQKLAPYVALVKSILETVR